MHNVHDGRANVRHMQHNPKQPLCTMSTVESGEETTRGKLSCGRCIGERWVGSQVGNTARSDTELRIVV